MTALRGCDCLSTWDRRDGARCSHDSWGRPRPAAGNHPWATPDSHTPVPLVMLGMALLAVLFTAALVAGQAAMCAAHDDALRYCPGYQATSTDEPQR